MTYKNLRNYVIGAFLALNVASCVEMNYPEYHFRGLIGEEQVHFHERAPFLSQSTNNYLEVSKKDTTILFYDYNNDLKIEGLNITVGNNTTIYNSNSNNPEIRKVIEMGQQKFEYYLNKITEIQTTALK